MTRQEIIKQFDIDENGRIISPGKFEGEMIYAPYFYDSIGNGIYDDWDIDDDIMYFHYNVIDEDIEQFPELKDAKKASLWEDDNGFVYCNLD